MHISATWDDLPTPQRGQDNITILCIGLQHIKHIDLQHTTILQHTKHIDLQHTTTLQHTRHIGLQHTTTLQHTRHIGFSIQDKLIYNLQRQRYNTVHSFL